MLRSASRSNFFAWVRLSVFWISALMNWSLLPPAAIAILHCLIRLLIRERNSDVAASVNVTTSILSTVNGCWCFVSELPCPSSRRRYSEHIVNVLPVPAEASIRRAPNSGKLNASSWVIDMDIRALIATGHNNTTQCFIK